MRRNIIITGGELLNKGAQAMTFVTVDALKKRFPDHDIYVLSDMDFHRPEEEKSRYAFQFTEWYPIKFARAQKNRLLRLACLLRHRKDLVTCESLYRNCDLMVDISGYGLGSIWGVKHLRYYLDHLEYAQSFGIPCYLLPQSFGPFDFSEDQKEQAGRIPELLSSVKVICAREKEGYEELLSRYHLKNVVLCTDLVLSHTDIDLNHIFKAPAVCNLPMIEKNGVAIIPNVRCAELISEQSFCDIYRSVIDVLLENGKTVYLMTHATEDFQLCVKIKSLFSDSEKVVFLDRDFNCLEFNELVKMFDFLVASRYHSIVHALKNEVPCITIGWAVKYKALMENFSQEEYSFDLRDAIALDSIRHTAQQLCTEYTKESGIIHQRLWELQKKDAFQYIREECRN